MFALNLRMPTNLYKILVWMIDMENVNPFQKASLSLHFKEVTKTLLLTNPLRNLVLRPIMLSSHEKNAWNYDIIEYFIGIYKT